MKLQKLTIVNMASLEGEHVIDFEEEPLKSTGLFSIVGDTGSGKSTILDAICLALYGLAPRFYDSRNFDYYGGEQQNNNRDLQPDDPRNILRRGTKECSSEVVFTARDGQRYRARWACSIARTNYTAPERSLYMTVRGDDGRLTEVRVSIHDGSYRGYGHKNIPNDNLDRIIGLDYGQFTRTVMLAQNSFANFIKADSKDKAVLLEMLTGTELYTKVARKIYERFKGAEKSFYELENRVQGIRGSLLTDERLSQLRGEAAALDASVQALRGREDLLKRRLRLAADSARLLSDKDALKKKHDGCVSSLQSKKEKLASERQLLDKARGEQERLAPQIAKARETKVEVNAKKEAADRLQTDVSTLKDGIAALKEELSANKESQDKENKCLADCKATLEGLAAHKDMLENAALVTERLEGLHSLVEQYGQASKDAEEMSKRLDKRQSQLASQTGALQETRDALAREKLRIDEEYQQLRTVDISRLQDKLAQLQDSLATFRECSALFAKRNELANELSKAESAYAELEKECAALEKEYGSLVSERNDIQKCLPGLEDAYRLMRSRNVVQMRAALREGLPCPVCGATSHPYFHGIEQVLSPLEGEIRQKRERYGRIAELLDAPKTGLTARLADVKANRGREKLHKEQCLAGQTETERRIAALQKAHPQIAPESIEAEIASMETERGAVSRSCDEWIGRDRKLSSERADYESRLKAADKSGRMLDSSVRKLECERGQLSQKLAQLETDEVEISARHEILAGMVSIEDWNSMFETDYPGLMRKLSAMYGRYKAASDGVQTAAASLDRLRVAAGGLQKQIDEKGESLEKLLPEAHKADDEYKAKRNELLLMLDGKDPDAVERGLKDAVDAQSGRVEAAVNACHKLEVECAQLEAKGQETERQYKDCLSKIEVLKVQEGDDAVGDDALEAAIRDVAARLAEADERRSSVRGFITAHEQNERQMEAYRPELEARRKVYDDWRDLNSILGNANGDKFRETAQCFTLGFLVRQANVHLRTLGRRYGLEQVKDTLGIRIIDHDRADEQRNISSLSGGETFVISLALALGLSSLSSANVPMANLFVDEGFGSLDSGSLNMVIDALSSLQSVQGKKVGVISHTPEMRERIHTQVRVVKTGAGGRSYIEVV